MTQLPLPAPPDAYWAQIPWWAYIGFLIVALLIVVVIGPWMIQRARNQPSAVLGREQRLQMREQAFAQRLDQELAETTAERDRAWSIARGWNAHAHQLWHDQNNALISYNALLTLCRKVGDGRLPINDMREMLTELLPLPPLQPLPLIDAVEPKKPGETRYA